MCIADSSALTMQELSFNLQFDLVSGVPGTQKAAPVELFVAFEPSVYICKVFL